METYGLTICLMWSCMLVHWHVFSAGDFLVDQAGAGQYGTSCGYGLEGGCVGGIEQPRGG